MAEVIELNADGFEEEVINSELPVLVDCWAPWCQPCLMVAPIVEEVAEEYVRKHWRNGKSRYDYDKEHGC